MTLQEIFEEIPKLSAQERKELIHTLLDSLQRFEGDNSI
jgi:hypothetical protein